MLEFSWYGLLGTALLGIGTIFTIAACMIDDIERREENDQGVRYEVGEIQPAFEDEIELEQEEQVEMEQREMEEDSGPSEDQVDEEDQVDDRVESDLNTETGSNGNEHEDYDDAHSEDEEAGLAEKIADEIFGSWDDVLGCESLEAMAEYADHVVVRDAQDTDFVAQQAGRMLARINSPDLDEYFAQWNSTSLGNIAYLWVYGIKGYEDVYRVVLTKFLQHSDRKLKFDL